jgi:hypothetical protein
MYEESVKNFIITVQSEQIIKTRRKQSSVNLFTIVFLTIDVYQ